MPVTGLNHVGLSTPDLEQALAFYRDALGFTEVVRFGWEAGNDAADAGLGLTGTAASLAVLNAGNAYLEILQFDQPVPVRLDHPPTLHREGITHIALHVADAEDVLELVIAAGGSRAELPGGTVPMVRDPDGNLLELHAGPRPGRHHLHVPHDDPVADRRPRPDSGSPGAALVHGLLHAGICTLDTEATVAFYRQAGLTVVDARSWGEGAPAGGRMTTLDCGNADLELLEYRGVPVASRPTDARIIEYGFNHLCVDVDDIAADHRSWSAAGMTCFAPWTVMPGGHAAMGYALDVQRTPLELLEHRSARSTMWPGHLALRD